MIEVLNVLCWFLVVSGLLFCTGFLLYIWYIVIMKSYKFITSKRRYEEKWMLWTEEQLDWAVISLIVFICYISYTILGG